MNVPFDGGYKDVVHVVVTDEGREFHNEIARWKYEPWSKLVYAKGKI